MEHYTFLRQLADSWGLLAMTFFYLAAIAWAFRPGRAELNRDLASIPLRNDTALPPAGDETETLAKDASNG